MRDEHRMDQLNLLVNEVGHLRQAQHKFHLRLTSEDSEDQDGPQLFASGVEALFARFLGYTITASPHLILIDGGPAFEYTFVEAVTRTPLCQYYLARGGEKYELRTGASLESASHQLGNDHLRRTIALEVCEALLASLVLKPSPLLVE